MPLRTLSVLVIVLAVAGFLGFQIEISLPTHPPDLASTYTPITQAPPKGLGSYDVLGHPVSQTEAATLLQTEAGQAQLSPDQGAVEITEDLLALGRETFYRQTFGNEVLFTDVIGILDGPLSLPKLTKAILGLRGQPTDNLQVTLDKTVQLGDRTFPAGTVINTGLDVPGGSVFPLGLVTHIDHARPQVGITCALCHATVNPKSGQIIEGATNIDVNLGLLLAMAPNSATLFRQTDVRPTEIPPGSHSYINDEGELAYLPDAEQLEAAVDEALLSWPPGNFVSNGDLKNNSAQVPSSYTHEAFPYAWSGVASIGWFHGLTTLNNAVFGLNADPTTTADAAPDVLDIPKETYLGSIFQNAPRAHFRLPEGAHPSEFFEAIDPTPGAPGLNATIKMPEYPKGTLFMQNGLMAATPGHLAAEELNAMSAWQNTLAPPPNKAIQDVASVQRGAKVFDRANCASCHSGRYFTNHRVIAQRELKTEPLRAPASKDFAEAFVDPDTYAPNVPVPLPANPRVLPVPTDITPEEDIQLAYAQSDPAGGYKVMKLIGAYLQAPYLHDGGVAASATALKPTQDGWFEVADPAQIGMVGTFMRGIRPDAAASLRMLVDRRLRQPMVEVNRAAPDLQRSHVTGQGHEYWVDQKAGFEPQDQTDLINFVLALDDDPIALPPSVTADLVAARDD
jgi:hypothetical protein